MSVKHFYEIEEQRILNEATKVSLFTKHPSTLGEFREDLLREYLKKFTPGQLTVKSGFMADYRGTGKDEIFNEQTRQIDFLVYDKTKDVSFFETDNFAIVKPNCTYAAIEIKSKLTFYQKSIKNKDGVIDENCEGYFGKDFIYSGTLVDAMKNILSVSNIAKDYNQTIFTAIFAYDTDFEPLNLYKALDFQQLQMQLGIEYLHQLPFCICVPRKFFITIDEHDMFDIKYTASLGEGVFSMIGAHESHSSLPIQMFTNTYYNNLRFYLDKSKPDSGGIFNPSPGMCTMFSKQFDIF